MKVVINNSFGGFELSKWVWEFVRSKVPGFPVYEEYGFVCNDDFGIESDNFYQYRTHPALVEAVEKVEVVRDLKVVEVPDGINFTIFDYDGLETVIEVGHFWS